MKNPVFLKLFLILFLIPLIISCDKDKEETIRDSDIDTMTDEAIASHIFNDVFAQVSIGGWLADQAIRTPVKSVSAAEGGACPDITITPFNTTEWPKTVVLDFGDQCIVDGITRAGKIIITASKRFWEKGSEWSIEFDDFYFQNHRIQGTKSVSFNGRNEDNNFNWDISVQDAVITSPAQASIQWSAERNREWIDGDHTPLNPANNEYLIRGTGSGISSAGIIYSTTIREPLNILLSCPWVRSGVLVIDAAGRPETEVDFGDGECNSSATITVNGQSTEISLE